MLVFVYCKFLSSILLFLLFSKRNIHFYGLCGFMKENLFCITCVQISKFGRACGKVVNHSNLVCRSSTFVTDTVVTHSYRIYSKSNCCVLKHSEFWCLDFITDDDKVWLFGMIYSFKKSSSSAASVRDNFHFQKIAGCKFVGNLHSFMLHQRTITKTKIRN